MDKVIELLSNFGLTNSESKVYVSLLQMDASTGYKISGKSGIARSKVYNILSTLVEKGLVMQSKEEKPLYTALPVNELVSKLQHESEQNIEGIKDALSNVGSNSGTGLIWGIEKYDQVFDKIIYQVRNAKESLYIQIYSEDLSKELVEALSAAESRLHKFVLILFSNHHRYNLPFDRFYKHFFEADKESDYGGRWVNCVSDQKTVTYGKLPENSQNVDVIWTQNSSMIFLAQEYVVHDAYNLRTLNALNESAQKVFGKTLEGVRDIYLDD
ncbi:TrmB family transcriptional regulator [Secundilactobacillus yichangensis]|uniref:TrmB family transcriptional regulator n=1 Tax=Secundilactobacillus yichangensis TaxID=2799580 RepID=UPI0019454255|nr:helix-turn-helix domain-containing protein [Secundilactobacillus yichangensis]